VKRFLVLAPLAACLSVPDGPAPECKVTSDCDTANGEVCDEGICYGNPPPGPFAALVSPPSERKNDVVSREVELLEIPADGHLGDVALDAPVTYTGQIRAFCPTPSDCTDISLGATITVTRPSIFQGGPTYRQVVTTEPRTGLFQLVVPRTRDIDQPYTITVIPEGRGDEPDMGITPAQLVPPLRTELRIADNETGKTLDLGGITLATIDGKVTNSVGVGQGSYRVVALGRWDETSPITEVSTVFYTGNDGQFALRLSPGLQGSVEIVARPYGDPLQPTLHANVSSGGVSGKSLVAPANLGQPTTVDIKVKGTATGGEIKAVNGARVTVAGVVPGAAPGSTVATFVTEVTTGEDGIASVTMLNGTAIRSSYRVSIIPPANSTLGILFDSPLVLGEDPDRTLPERIALVGRVIDVDGKPINDVQVTVRPSLRFQWSLDTLPQAFMSAIPAATTVTPDTGEFVVYVDPFLKDGSEDVWGYYDLSFEPTATSNAPTFTEFDVEIPRDTNQSSVPLADIYLPDAAHIHGRITDPFGNVVEGAELKVFRVEDFASLTLCSDVPHAPASCPIPAQLLGRGASDDVGIVRLTLPRP